MQHSITHRASLGERIGLRLHHIWKILTNENRRFGPTVLGFAISIVPASLGIAFAAFGNENVFLAAILLLTVLNISLCLARASLKAILLSGIASMLASGTTIIYTVIFHYEIVQKFL